MTIEVAFKEGSRVAYAKSVAQYDHKISLHFSGIMLPEKFDAHFSNSRDSGIATIVKGENYTVRIPDVYLQSGDYVYGWIVVNKVSEYRIVIPVEKRAQVYQMNDSDDEGEKTYAFEMVDDDTLGITTIDEDQAPPPSISGWSMGEDETLEWNP